MKRNNKIPTNLQRIVTLTFDIVTSTATHVPSAKHRKRLQAATFFLRITYAYIQNGMLTTLHYHTLER